MITTITVADIARFGPIPEVMDDLRVVNYVFGANGTGKTTLARVLAKPTHHAACKCSWSDGLPLEAFVLNRDFVETNFSQLRGVFTLGGKEKAIEEQLASAIDERQVLQKNHNDLKRTLEGDDGSGGKKAELAELEARFRDKFWVPIEKIKQAARLTPALKGVQGNKETCKSKIIAEHKTNKGAVCALADLEKRAATLFGADPSDVAVVQPLRTKSLVAHEKNAILAKKVLGKEDIDIAAMIQKLGNSDWVQEGVQYFRANDKICPFCQQRTAESFAQSLEQYFDETFARDMKEVNGVISQYAIDASELQAVVSRLAGSNPAFLELEDLKAQMESLDRGITANKLRLEKKKKEPSLVIQLESLRPILTKIQRLLLGSQQESRRHNQMVANISKERQALVADVWRYVLTELSGDLREYHELKEKTEKAIGGLTAKLTESSNKLAALTKRIQSLEKQATSIRPTIDAINSLLSQFGFDGFKLEASADGKHYTLVRPNGDDARQTLSEGEKSFVVFLYFYHLLAGSIVESGTANSRIVVFDDPVSSLDSDVLFIVSSLIKNICARARGSSGNLKQVFILTHNVYFFKEVAFNPDRRSGTLNDETFWVLRRHQQYSKAERQTENPIRSSYELLWQELRSANPVTLRHENVMRRILEHYFKILGSIDFADICDKFDGQDKIVCRSLFSWVHAGSHSILDDLAVTPSDTMLQNAMRVFKMIFEKTDHVGHYNMMMGLPAQSSPSTSSADQVKSKA